jgi:hypothetical protein
MYYITRILLTFKSRFRYLLLALWRRSHFNSAGIDGYTMFKQKGITFDAVVVAKVGGQPALALVPDHFPSAKVFETDKNLQSIAQNDSEFKSVFLILPGNDTSYLQELTSLSIPEKVEACAVRFAYYKRGFSYGTMQINEIMRDHDFNLFDVVYSQPKYLQPTLDILFVKVDGTIETTFFAAKERK